MLACLRLWLRRTTSKEQARVELKTKAVGFKAGHVIPISLLTVDNVTVRDCIADDHVHQCVCTCTDFCPKLYCRFLNICLLAPTLQLQS